MSEQYDVVIGLEIHVQLNTKSKLFCACSNDSYEATPNTNICPICTGHPGTLPVLNEQAVESILRLGTALGCELADESLFARKHYFYPDLPKGYQISQYETPFCTGGSMLVERPDGSEFTVTFERLHLEEDAGKLVHKGRVSHVDLNRAGTPLIECVTDPVIASPSDARLFLQSLRQLVRYVGVSEADMQKGHLRCDANISLRPVGETTLYPKTEIKNVNSFRFVEQALEYEIERQTALWKAGTPVDTPTTRGYNESTGETVEQRRKEGQADYRYFPEPDLPPVTVHDDWRSALQRHLPELPRAKKQRFMRRFGLSKEQANLLTDDRDVANVYEGVVSELTEWVDSFDPEQDILPEESQRLTQAAAKWFIGPLFRHLKDSGRTIHQLSPTLENIAELIALQYNGDISSSAAQTIWDVMLETGQDPSQIKEEKGLGQIQDLSAIQSVVDTVVSTHADAVADYKGGKEQSLQFLVGQVMKETRGAADPEKAREALLQTLRK